MTPLPQSAALRPAKHSEPDCSALSPLEIRCRSWKQQAEQLRDEVQVLWFILRDPRTPWYARVTVACAVGYLFSPIQLIPSFIPVIGFLDDFVVLSVGFRLAHWLAPESVIYDARRRARTYAIQRSQEAPTLAGRAGVAVIATIWLALMAVGLVWMYKT
jgi:uncharacterized membrane protein YkvA (DUF1232 family)